ncbi:molybdopterin molybdotransferase MoeA [Pelotomaculum terephthalicicum JT]|uniref:molybdopterin molybdotransferase MoeA n=1 Tax=Pelotomaculum terephthalicicum TaxID=206393 RepID=UPI0009C893BB|nr:gephyrin-like molybdotransferase Glp [Pelotomaculum terephthalicicum]MCG9968891.1 molybdopterin molybdotransferase MoeA [Pelotomaculum terephthalicicum JT]OPY61575.1 MAG: Molybdopterin molybdenumtransferase [Pelotomaculum sp. PtaU1.Bin065]
MRNNNLAVSIEEALKIILNSISPLTCENISIMEACNRVLYEDIVSDIIIPPADDSAMDGYAVIAEDTLGASINHPIKLQITGEIQSGGSVNGKKVSRGTAIRIMTGAPMPEGADAVIKFEDAAEEDGYVNIFQETVKYKNYRFAGENIKKGDKVLRKGDRLSSVDVGILASLNYNTVKVYKQPIVSIISTGDELADIGEEIRTGQIRNVNAYTIYSEVKKYNAIPYCLGIAKDTLKDMKEIFLKALKSDVVISTGGASMGRYDFVKDIYLALDVEIQFEKVNVKPGKPVIFGKKDNQLFFGLPGNPVSTLTSFIQFVRPALLRLMGANRILKPIVNAFLEEDINKKSGRVNLLRGYATIKDNEFYVSTTGNQNSSVLTSMRDANCLIIIPENTKVKAGEKVRIQLIEHEEI